MRFTAAVALAVAPLAAADFWQEKKFTEWNEKQVRRLLEDSPWARPISLADEGSSGRIAKGGMGDASSRGNSRDPSTARPPEAAPTITAIVRWHTALPVKQAVARMRFGNEAGTSAEAAKLLGRQEDRYVCGISNVPSAYVEGSIDELKKAIRLKVKGKPDIAPEEIEKDARGGRAALFITFPKGRGGAPVIDVGDNEVELEVRLPELKIGRKFKLKDMVFDGKLEM